jgi:hypothetical protein
MLFNSLQANIVLGVYIVVGLYIILNSYKINKNVVSGANLILLLIVLGYALILAYDVNCLIQGKCNTWAWIKTIALLTGPIMMFSIMNSDEYKKMRF